MANTPTDNWSGEQLEALFRQGLSYGEIEQRTGLTYPQIKGRLYRYRRQAKRSEAVPDDASDETLDYSKGHPERKPQTIDRGDSFLVYWPYTRRAFEITKTDLRRLKQLYCEQRMTINQVCRELDIPRPDFFLIKTAFGITKDDVPYLDEDIMNGDLDELADESLERRKRDFFIKLEHRQYEQALQELAKYRRKDHFTTKLAETLGRAVQPLTYEAPRYTPP